MFIAEVLGIERNATKEEIRKAYRKVLTKIIYCQVYLTVTYVTRNRQL